MVTQCPVRKLTGLFLFQIPKDSIRKKKLNNKGTKDKTVVEPEWNILKPLICANKS